jgi:glycosyltransferase involved in cell wall biosynthesis
MLKRLLNKFKKSQNKLILAQLALKLQEISENNAVLVLYGSPTEGNWKGIANATVGLFPSNSLEIPQWYSNAVFNQNETIEICTLIQQAKFEKIVISGFAPYFFDWIEFLHLNTKIEVVYHGTISEFHDPSKQDFVEQLISFGKAKKISRVGFVKEGLAEVFTKLYDFDCYHQPLNQPIIPDGLKKIALDETKIHVGVFGADTFNKNLHNQVIHALMIDNVVVHVLDKSIFNYLGMNDRIVEHGENLPREQFLAILGSMDLNLYMSFNESWGLVAKESEAMGVSLLSISNVDYLKLIFDKIEKRI